MQKVREGFTLVELSLSMVFVGVLSLAVIFVINNAVISYRRSNTLGQVNSVGMDIVDDMRSAIQGSSAKSLSYTCEEIFADNTYNDRQNCINDNTYKFVNVKRMGTVIKKDGSKIENVPLYGAFCTGSYSYVWNSGYYWSGDVDDSKISPKLRLFNNNEYIENFKLLKIEDISRAICVAAVYRKDVGSGNVDAINNYNSRNPFDGFNVINVNRNRFGNVKSDSIVDLITKDNSAADNLALYDLNVEKPAVSKENNSVFYSVSFILGTVDGGMNIKSSGSACKAPNDYDSNFDYCAINKFSFAIRATGE